MTADQLHKMQEECKKRHRAIFSMGVIMPVEEPRSFSQVIDESFELKDDALKPKKQERKKKDKIILPDLMAAELSLPCTSDQKEIPVIKKQEVMGTSQKVWDSMFNKPHVPKPVQEKKRPYVHFTALPPDPPKQKEERPPATYTNSRSPYGIYDELKEEWNKKTG